MGCCFVVFHKSTPFADVVRGCLLLFFTDSIQLLTLNSAVNRSPASFLFFLLAQKEKKQKKKGTFCLNALQNKKIAKRCFYGEYLCDKRCRRVAIILRFCFHQKKDS
jgi:hypothetical protein